MALLHQISQSDSVDCNRRRGKKPEKYRAVFVVPSKVADMYTSQVFKGDVEKGRKTSDNILSSGSLGFEDNTYD
jgi:hypothetical protein